LELGSGLGEAICRQGLVELHAKAGNNSAPATGSSSSSGNGSASGASAVFSDRSDQAAACESQGRLLRQGGPAGLACRVGDRVNARFHGDFGELALLADVRPERGVVWLDWDDLGVNGREVPLEDIAPLHPGDNQRAVEGAVIPCGAALSNVLVTAAFKRSAGSQEIPLCVPAACLAGSSPSADDFLQKRRGGSGEDFLRRFAWGRMLDSNLAPEGPVPARAPPGLTVTRW